MNETTYKHVCARTDIEKFPTVDDSGEIHCYNLSHLTSCIFGRGEGGRIKKGGRINNE